MITIEEYELLKNYRAIGYRWIARDGDDECVYVYKSKPIKLGSSWGDNERGCSEWSLNDDSLPYIKREDEEPTKINDLIRDYESHQVIVGEKVNKAELMKEIDNILDDIGVSDYQSGEYEEDTIWAISSITIRKIFSAIEKHSLDNRFVVEQEKLYTVRLKNGYHLCKYAGTGVRWLNMTEFNTADCYKLTQSEIESVDPRLMQFAVEVE